MTSPGSGGGMKTNWEGDSREESQSKRLKKRHEELPDGQPLVDSLSDLLPSSVGTPAVKEVDTTRSLKVSGPERDLYSDTDLSESGNYSPPRNVSTPSSPLPTDESFHANFDTSGYNVYTEEDFEALWKDVPDELASDDEVELVSADLDVLGGKVAAAVQPQVVPPVRQTPQQAPQQPVQDKAATPVAQPVAAMGADVVLKPMPFLALPNKDFVEAWARRVIHVVRSGAKDSTDPAVTRIIEHYKKVMGLSLAEPFTGEPTVGTGTGATGGPKNNALYLTRIEEAMKSVATDFKSGFTMAGQWATYGIASGPNYKSTVRDLQLANQLSQALISFTGATEVEAMIVNGRILVSANEQVAVEKLCETTLNDVFAELDKKTDLEVWQKRKTDKLRSIREVLKGTDTTNPGKARLAALIADSHLWEPQAAAVFDALAVLKDFDGKLERGGPFTNGATLIDDDKYRGKIIVVDAVEKAQSVCAHAEQNLAAALVSTGHHRSASIAGGKRPCTNCFLSLCLVQRCGYKDLRFNRHPGGYWVKTTSTGLQNIASGLKLQPAQLKELYQDLAKTGFQQHLTDTTPGAAASTPINPRESVNKNSLHRSQGTPSQSSDFV